MSETQALTEALWERYYEPIDCPDGGTVWELRDAQRFLDELGMTDAYLWTVLIDDDTATMWVASGVWKVNALGYVVTRQPHEGSLIAPWGQS